MIIHPAQSRNGTPRSFPRRQAVDREREYDLQLLKEEHVPLFLFRSDEPQRARLGMSTWLGAHGRRRSEPRPRRYNAPAVSCSALVAVIDTSAPTMSISNGTI